MSLVELIQSLETIAGAHGVGRVDMVENRLVGIKSREIYEAPAAVVLHTAHRELQAFVTPRDLERLTSELGVKYADLVYNGLWYTPTREAIDALVAEGPGKGHRHHPAEVLQGRLPRRRPQVAVRAVRPRDGDATTRATSSITPRAKAS